MKELLRLLAAVLTAASMSACSTASLSDMACGTSPLAPSTGQAQEGRTPQAAQRSADTSGPSDARRQQEAQKVVEQYTAVTDPNSKAYKIGPRDVLEVTVFKVPELSKIVQVSERGTIYYPLAGEIVAGGRTPHDIEMDLTKGLGAKYLQNPSVIVLVKEYNSQRITVEGNVNKPGVFPMTGEMTLLQAIAQAGGFTTNADKTVILFRMADGKRLAGKYDVPGIRAGDVEDPPLQPGDIVIVETSQMREGVDWVVKFLPLATLAPLF